MKSARFTKPVAATLIASLLAAPGVTVMSWPTLAYGASE